MNFIDTLKSDLQYPARYQSLFNRIEKPEELAQMLKNKDSYVRDKSNSSKLCLEGNFRDEDLEKKGLVRKTSIGEIVVNKTFAIKGSFRSEDIVVKGPVVFEKDVIVGRSTILGPAYVSERSKIFDSLIRGGPNGSVYIGSNCVLWDYTVVIRSFIGDDSSIHTCNIDDSIVGPNSNFGGAKVRSNLKLYKTTKSAPRDTAKLDQRIVLANYSFGNRIKIVDPTTDAIVQTEADHFGTIAGSNVSLASGTILYPGTVIGSGAKITSTIPVIGYIPPRAEYSLFLSITKDKKNGKKKIELKGSLMREHTKRSSFWA